MVDQTTELGRVTLAANENYDTKACVRLLRDRSVTSHVAKKKTNRRSAIHARAPRHQGDAISQRKRKLAEQLFGSANTAGLMHRTRHRGTELADSMFSLTADAFNLVRIRNLEGAT